MAYWTAVVLFALIGVLVVALPVPYVVLGPGEVCNTVGGPSPSCQLSTPTLVTITPPSARHLKPDSLDLTTVSVSGRTYLYNAIAAWLDPHVAVVPRDLIYPPGQSDQQVQQADIDQMQQSQLDAAVAALTVLHDVEVTVVKVVPGYPAAGRILPGDVLRTLNGQPVVNAQKLLDLLASVHPGQRVAVGLLRRGHPMTVSLTTTHAPSDPSVAVLGVQIDNRFTHGLGVRVGLQQVGGPSAGLMLSLGILDELLPYSLTGGRIVAGTGTIDQLGTVGPIGGIQQKMYAARHFAHATVFLAPSGDCADARAAIPAGLQVVRVDTLAGALHALAQLRAGHTALPGC